MVVIAIGIAATWAAACIGMGLTLVATGRPLPPALRFGRRSARSPSFCRALGVAYLLVAPVPLPLVGIGTGYWSLVIAASCAAAAIVVLLAARRESVGRRSGEP